MNIRCFIIPAVQGEAPSKKIANLKTARSGWFICFDKNTFVQMILHSRLGNSPFERSRNLLIKIQQNEISLGGYKKDKIYGTLSCNSGKRMKISNRIFFKDENEAIKNGYRPCAHCMSEKYKRWKT
jgi:hypothetical protein